MENISGLCCSISCFDTSSQAQRCFTLVAIALGVCPDEATTRFHYVQHVDICLQCTIKPVNILKIKKKEKGKG